jgi:hypothetical protein
MVVVGGSSKRLAKGDFISWLGSVGLLRFGPPVGYMGNLILVNCVSSSELSLCSSFIKYIRGSRSSGLLY